MSYSLYVHIPWCRHKCPYCDFNAHVANNRIDEEQYEQRLYADLRSDLTDFPFLVERTLKSVYIGGGTPNILSAATIARLVDNLLAMIPNQATRPEITIELNPECYKENDFATYMAAGINRASLGVQTFDTACLRLLERTHTVQHNQTILEDALRTFPKVNVDLIFGMNKQTKASALNDISTLIQQGVQHISWYQLTIEPNSKFYSHTPVVASDSCVHTTIEQSEELLESNGFAHYEVSAFATNNAHQSHHNKHYWQFGDYVGIGAGACSKITDEKNVVWRTKKTRHPKDYLQKRAIHTICTRTQVERNQLPFEFLLNALRLAQGFTWQQFETHTHHSPKWLRTQLASFVEQSLLLVDDTKVRPTRLGWHGLDSILEVFM